MEDKYTSTLSHIIQPYSKSSPYIIYECVCYELLLIAILNQLLFVSTLKLEITIEQVCIKCFHNNLVQSTVVLGISANTIIGCHEAAVTVYHEFQKVLVSVM